MSRRTDKKTITELFLERTPIDEALRRGVRKALLRHKKLGHSIVVCRDGKTILLPPDQIDVAEDE